MQCTVRTSIPHQTLEAFMGGDSGVGAEWKWLLERIHSLPESQPIFIFNISFTDI